MSKESAKTSLPGGYRDLGGGGAFHLPKASVGADDLQVAGVAYGSKEPVFYWQ
jgi:hypothetical protein